MNRRILNKRGVTLVELILTLALAAIVIPLIYSILVFGIRTFNLSSDQTSLQQGTRAQADYIVREIRRAKDISSSPDKFEGQPYYSFLLRTEGGIKSLVQQRWEGGLVTKEKVVGSDLDNLWFLPHEKSGILGLKIENKLSKQDYSLEVEVLLDNIKEKINIPGEGITAIYYTKYD